MARHLEALLERLYYWAERANEEHAAPSDGVAPHMLKIATDDLHLFVTTFLDCFGPIELAPTPIPIGDLIASIVLRARTDLRAASVTVSGAPSGVVIADAVYLERTWSGILRRLRPQAAGGTLHLTVAPGERGGRRGVEINLTIAVKPPTTVMREPMAEVEWVLARRIVGLHAGEVWEHEGAREQTVAVFLPTEAVPDE